MPSAALFCRVAAADPDALQHQYERIRQWAGDHGYTVTNAIVLDGIGASDPAIDRALDSLQSVDAVIMECPDRLARKLQLSVARTDRLKQRGIAIIVVSTWH